jgi:hypothetical protein
MFLVSCGAFAVTSVQGQDLVGSIKLEGLLHGVSVTEQARLKIADIRVGEVSVKHLFDYSDQRVVTWWEYYGFKKTTTLLKVGDREKLAQLQQALILAKTARLRVILHDDRQTIWRGVPGLNSEDLYTRSIEFAITKTPCDIVTEIVYSGINSIIKKRIEKTGITDKDISLNEVFDELLHDNLEPYMASLSKVEESDPCFKTFQLMKWIRGDDAPGFDSGEYKLHEGLQRALEPTIVALLQTYSNWSKFNLKIRVVGYTDPQVVITNKDFLPTNSGFTAWDVVEEPYNLRYSGCRNDHLAGSQPTYLELNKNFGTLVTQVNDNCKLGAARAYVATVYIKYKLALSAAEFYYATGGIYRADKRTSASDPSKRRIDVEFTVKTAKENGDK